jgi:hypothetical protein
MKRVPDYIWLNWLWYTSAVWLLAAFGSWLAGYACAAGVLAALGITHFVGWVIVMVVWEEAIAHWLGHRRETMDGPRGKESDQ